MHPLDHVSLLCGGNTQSGRRALSCVPCPAFALRSDVHDQLPLIDLQLAQVFGPLAFFDVRGQELQPPNSSSLENVLEAQLVLSLYTALVKEYSELKDRPSFGIISPYLAQVNACHESPWPCCMLPVGLR